MDRRDWLTLLLAYKGAEGSGPALDPVRAQKGMFLLAMEGGLPDDERYPFRPYNYGPYSSNLKGDLEQLVREGLAESVPVPGYTWSRYHLTHEGMTLARELVEDAPRETLRKLFSIKQMVTGLSFNELLRQVYAKYPEYAANSVFAG